VRHARAKAAGLLRFLEARAAVRSPRMSVAYRVVMQTADGYEALAERKQRDELAAAVERQAHAIVDRWLERVRRDAAAARVPLTELRDGIADYLTRLVQLLRSRDEIGSAGAKAWADVAREHAVTRVRLGFDVSQLFRELITLHHSTTELLRADGLLQPYSHTDRLAELIEMAISESIKSYVDFRDYQARRSEAEHIGFLSHELRNPLGAISLAASELRTGPPQARERLLDILDRNVERLRKLVEDVLAAERLDAGEVEVRPVDVTLGILVSDALEWMRATAHAKGIELVARFDPEMRLHVDTKLTLSAIENLLDNAIKYTDDGVVSLDVEDHGDEIAVHVRDNCEGLSAEELRVIFEPFRRAHATKPGTGLGLALVRRAVEVQGGHVTAESLGDRGCHFWFTLPTTHH
jgi:two-component system sensor histidine kinase TorS